MDPWDIDISELSQKYIGVLKKLKEMDCRISGKVLLAAAILLKIKSNRLVGEDIAEFDRMCKEPEGLDEEEFYDELKNEFGPEFVDKFKILPRTPQPRKRKVSIYDLVGALQQALQTKRKKVLANIPAPAVKIPEKKYDIENLIEDIYTKVIEYLEKNSKLTFSQLLPSEEREDKVYTFIPLLYLENQRRIEMSQETHFGEIGIAVKNGNEVSEEKE
jgi:segregation and condensation protein A